MIHSAAFTASLLARTDRALIRHMPNLMAPKVSNYLKEDPHCGYNEASSYFHVHFLVCDRRCRHHSNRRLLS